MADDPPLDQPEPGARVPLAGRRAPPRRTPDWTKDPGPDREAPDWTTDSGPAVRIPEDPWTPDPGDAETPTEGLV